MAQATAGIAAKWGIGTTSSAPSTWTAIPGVTEIPEIGGAPDTLETTSLDNLEYKTYISALKDTGGAIGLTANDTPEFRDVVAGIMAAQETAKTSTTAQLYIAIEIPSPVNERMVAQAEFTSLGFGGAAINSVLTTTFYVTMTSEPEWEDIS